MPKEVDKTCVDHVKHRAQHRMSKALLKKWLLKKGKKSKEQREANLIICRVKQNKKETSDERQNEDKQRFDALCNEVLSISFGSLGISRP